jgi:hypothetical protein
VLGLVVAKHGEGLAPALSVKGSREKAGIGRGMYDNGKKGGRWGRKVAEVGGKGQGREGRRGQASEDDGENKAGGRQSE